jgi:hypothetical protein
MGTPSNKRSRRRVIRGSERATGDPATPHTPLELILGELEAMREDIAMLIAWMGTSRKRVRRTRMPAKRTAAGAQRSR